MRIAYHRLLPLCLLIAAGACGDDSDNNNGPGMDEPPGSDVNMFPHEVGDKVAGKQVFRMETFGDQNFWTDVVKLPQGIMAAGLTPVQALKAGLNINIDAVDAATKTVLAAELMTDLSTANAPNLNNPATTIKLINENAVIGVVAFDTDASGSIDITTGDKVGVACSFCHAMTDGSVFAMPNGGTIGVELDGPTPHTLNVGATFALAANSRGLYPIAQLALTANGGATIGRAPTGLTELSTEAEVDAYFNNPAYYPVGMFDDQPDGTGAPMHITPMFRGDLSAPYGSEGTITKLDNFTNLVFTALLDQRNLIAPGGRAFLHTLGGAAGDEIADDYATILAATGVPTATGLEIATTGMPGAEETPVGVRVDNTKLLNMSAYMDSLPAPAGVDGDAAAITRAKQVFREQCTTCHKVDPGKFVPSALIPMIDIFPGDDPVVLAQRTAPLNPIEDTVGNIFDDKMVVVNASIRGDIRGMAIPLLLDLARKPVFLHDNSVPTLDNLFDSARGPKAPHPFYLDGTERTDMIALLKSFTAN